jgi:protein-tyrosine-phosphatase/DNA-binding transcriptional ArsR family regulator
VALLHVAPPEVLSLLGDPHRWQLLEELARSDRRVGELTDLVGVPQNLVSYHLRELRAAGIVSAHRSSADGRDVYYRADLGRCRDLLAAAGAAMHPALALVPPPPGAPPARRARRPRVLFLCTGNSSRSQMAEALLVHRSEGWVDARSAGSHPKPLHRQAVAVMADRGIDIAGNDTKHLRRFAHQRFTRVITLCDKVREVCPDFPGHPDPMHWSMSDPAAEPDADTPAPFERAADEIEERITVLLTELSRAEGSAHVR